MPQTRQRARILAVDVDCLTLAETADLVLDYASDGAPHQVVTVNPEFVMLARHHQTFLQVLKRADLATADGIGIVLAARIFGYHVPERIGGVDLWKAVAERARDRHHSLFLLGAGPGVAEAAANALSRMFPGLIVAGTYGGSPDPADAEEIIERVRSAQPSILGVAYGAPQQDVWIADYLQRLQVPVAIGLGGAFDFLAGRVPRAPVWLQRVGLEWLFRLAVQPWRWRRMRALPAFAALVLLHAPQERLARRK